MATSQPSFDDDRGEEDVEPMKRRSSVMAAQARRREFVALLSLAGLLAYCDRVNISVAIIDMSADHNWSLNERGQVRFTAGCSQPFLHPLTLAGRALLAGAGQFLLWIPILPNSWSFTRLKVRTV